MEEVKKQGMESLFVPYEIALALKELGFDEPCFGYYVGLGDSKEDPFKLVQIQSEKGQFEWTDNVYHAPLYQQAFRWFREKYGLFVSPNVISYEDGPYLWFFEINSTVLPFGTDLGETDDYKTYEEAELECIKKLIEIVKEK